MTDHCPENLNQGPPPHYFEEDRVSLTEILLVLARHTKVILITPTILCTLTIIYVMFIATPIYTSTTKIMSSSRGSLTQAAGLAAQFGLNMSTNQSESNWNYTEIIKSRTLARAILKRKFDTEEFGPQKFLSQILAGDDKSEYGQETLEIMAVETLLEMIDVSESIKTAVYTINIYASEAKLAAEINKVLIEELDIHQQEYNKAKVSEARQFIEERIVDTERELMAIEEDLKDFMDRNRRIENSPLLLLEQQRLSREVGVMTGVFTTLKQQLETTKIEEVKKSDFVLMLDPPEVPLTRSKPNKRLMVIMAGFFGIGLGIIFAFTNKYIKNINSEEQEKIGKAISIVVKNITDFIPQRFRKT